MKLWTRIKIGFGLVFGKKYGIIIDQDWARGGVVSDFRIRGADVGIYVVGPQCDPPPSEMRRNRVRLVDGDDP